MSFPKKTIKDIPLSGKTVLVRTGFDVPLKSDGDNISVADDYRIVRGLPTIKYLLDQKCKIVLVSKLGRPKGEDPRLSLRPVSSRLEELTKTKVIFCNQAVGNVADQAKKDLKPGQILMLENLLFDSRERDNDIDFASSVASQCDYFVQDGFSISHRNNALVDAIGQVLPSVAGLLLVDEVESIQHALKDSEKPRCAIVGGAKIKTKIELLNRLIDTMDMIAIGGAMANTFYVAQGIEVGSSLYDKDEVDDAKNILEKISNKDNLKFFIPAVDVAVAKSTEKGQPRKEVKLGDVDKGEIILDMGSESSSEFVEFIGQSKTVIWNGPLGMTTLDSFKHGSVAIADHLSESKSTYSLIGGGDTASFIDEIGLMSEMSFVSTGGGASLQLISGKKLPGVEVLLDK